MMAQKVVDKNIKIIAVILALVIALCHLPYILATISAPPWIPLFFLIATVLFAVGGLALLTSSKLAKTAVNGLLALAIIDSILILLTRTMAMPFAPGGRMLAWSMGSWPPGVLWVLILQIILIIIIAAKLRK